MLSLLRGMIAVLFTAMVVLAPVWSDDDIDAGKGGGGNGWGNLPGGYNVGLDIRGAELGGPRLTLNFADFRAGVNLRLSPEMSDAIARVSTDGFGWVGFAAQGRDLVLDGHVLEVLYDAGVTRLDIDIVSLHGYYLPISLRLAADGSVTVFVY